MSTNRALDRLMSNVRVSLPGALDAAVKLELFSAFDELCRTADVWIDYIDFETEKDVLTYPGYSPDNSGVVVRLHHVINLKNLSDQPIEVCPEVGATLDAENNITLRGMMNPATPLRAYFVLAPHPSHAQDDAPDVPLWMWDRYNTALQDGVMYRLMTQPAKPYSNERMAIYHGRRWQNAIGVARMEASRAFTHGAQNWRFPGGWSQRQRRR